MAMPVGALIAGPIAALVGVPATQYGAAALIVVASAFTLIPRDVRTMRSDRSSDAHLSAAHRAGVPPWAPDGAAREETSAATARDLESRRLIAQAASSASPANDAHSAA
jgi:hypothetical protein